ncbi:hypothetical protein GOP47_0001794 [Adiantum capillus-veneris]|uniref:BHLH domain-containing protein n=1 Tax=Adiantum capillus-veneris TaxID=13818 RepID=A0A9D4V8X8_ADICA|nr:hypothetical protein GOP47_0001794 [Adiantum capillus-veneris]
MAYTDRDPPANAGALSYHGAFSYVLPQRLDCGPPNIQKCTSSHPSTVPMVATASATAPQLIGCFLIWSWICMNHSMIHLQPGQSSQIDEVTLFGYTRRKKAGTSIYEIVPDEQLKIVEKLLGSMEDELLYMDSTSYAGKRKFSFQDRHYRPPLLRIEPAQRRMQLYNFLGSADTTTMSLLTKSEAHVLAERKRRDKLNQRFVALSAILPGVTKMDKASILGDAIKYVKQLEEHLKELEERKARTLSAESFYTTNIDRESIELVAIEARAFGNDVLIRVHCNKIKNIIVRCLEVLDRMPISIVHANVLSFSDSAMDLTFSAQIEQGSDLSAKDIVEALQCFFNQLQEEKRQKG